MADSMNKRQSDGNKKFQEFVLNNKNFFEKLSKKQKPYSFWIACMDSRVAPEIITNSNLGELFVTRTIANIVPDENEAVQAGIEYAVQHLGIKEIVVCGHYNCGGIKGLLDLNHCEQALKNWLSNSLHVKAKLDTLLSENKLEFSEADYENCLVEANILAQVKAIKLNKNVENKGVSVLAVVFDISSGKISSEMKNLARFGLENEFL